MFVHIRRFFPCLSVRVETMITVTLNALGKYAKFGKSELCKNSNVFFPIVGRFRIMKLDTPTLYIHWMDVFILSQMG